MLISRSVPIRRKCESNFGGWNGDIRGGSLTGCDVRCIEIKHQNIVTSSTLANLQERGWILP